MKTINYPNGFRKYFALLVCFIGVQFFSVNDLKAQGVCDCKNYVEGVDFAPTTCRVYCNMIKTFTSFDKDKQSKTVTISLKSFNNYYNSFDFQQDGFRIYYGYNEGELLQIISISNDSTYLDTGYYVLKNTTDYSINVKDFITRDSTIDLIKNFVNEFAENGKKITISRYYKYSGFTNLVSDVVIYNDKPSFISFEQCYVPLKVSEVYKNHPNVTFKDITDDFNVGYSTVMYLKKAGNENQPGDILTKDILINDNEYPKDYQGGFLEIGKPCPPRCGSIMWEDVIK